MGGEDEEEEVNSSEKKLRVSSMLFSIRISYGKSSSSERFMITRRRIVDSPISDAILYLDRSIPRVCFIPCTISDGGLFFLCFEISP